MIDKHPTLLGIIPARSGSKGVPEKNIRNVAGKPLMHYTIEAAQDSGKLSEYIVSTDSEEYAEIAREAGASVPFLRPDELATDYSATIDAVKHAVTTYEEQYQVRIDATVLLQPTTPLRKSSDIDAAIELFLDSRAESLISCYRTVHSHPNHLYEMTANNRVAPLRDQTQVPDRRQEFEPLFLLNGALYISTRDLIFEHDVLKEEAPVAYVMPRERSINIDEEFDLQLAEFLIENHQE